MKIFWMLFVALVFISCLQSQPDSGSQSPAEIQSIQFNYLGKIAQITGDADSLYLKVQQQSQTLLESGYSFLDATFKEDLIIKAQIPVQIQAQVFDELGELLWQADTSLLAQPDASIKLVLNLHVVSLGSSSSGVSSSSIASSSPSVWCDTPGNCGAFTDARDSKVYNWTKIGDQVWMAENLAYLPSVNAITEAASNEARYYVYNYDGTDVVAAKASSDYASYGVLYNWPAAMAGEATSSAYPSGVKGICPTGWHLPSTAEWDTLVNYVMDSSPAGTKLKSVYGWTSGAETGTDSYGFSALPSGYYDGSVFKYGFSQGFWWTATRSGITANIRNIAFDNVSVYAYVGDVYDGSSVRCLQDMTPAPSSSSSPSSSSVVMPSSSSNSVAWCATAGNCGTITDTRDNKTYNWTKIGTQTWMAENLDFGTYIANGSGTNQADATTTSAQKYCYGDNEDNCTTYGGLYQWHSVMALLFSCNSTPGIPGSCIVNTPHRGICPEGWHVPSDSEWTVLLNYAGGEGVAGGKLKEEGTIHWFSPNTGATNEFGFSALPGGAIEGYMPYDGYWWTSSSMYSSSATSMDMSFNQNFVSRRTGARPQEGYSVRCLQD
jgi:uncharacterized protein (TIGR02145 family)